MNELNEEIKSTINTMQFDIDDAAHGELQSHLYSLLEMKRNELQQRLVERAWAEPALGVDKAKPLTTDELKAGGWWCADVSAECAAAFKSKSINVYNSEAWDTEWHGWAGCLFTRGEVTRSEGIKDGAKQIHRIGNEFYWGEK